MLIAVLVVLLVKEPSKEIAGIPVELAAPIITAAIAAGAVKFAARQSTTLGHDQVVAQVAAVMQADNQDLRDELRNATADAREARREAHAARQRIAVLEAAMAAGGVPVPPEQPPPA